MTSCLTPQRLPALAVWQLLSSVSAPIPSVRDITAWTVWSGGFQGLPFSSWQLPFSERADPREFPWEIDYTVGHKVKCAPIPDSHNLLSRKSPQVRAVINQETKATLTYFGLQPGFPSLPISQSGLFSCYWPVSPALAPISPGSL